MSSRRRRLVLTTTLTTTSLVLGLVALTGCPGSGGSSSGEGGGGDTCSQYYDAIVGYTNRCEATSQSLNNSRSRFQELCARALNAPGAANLGSALSTCSGQLASASCTSSDLDCETNSGGTFDDGTPCGESYQCKGFCKKPSSDAQCGACAPRSAFGGPCPSGSSRECVDGARCVLSTTNTGTGTTQVSKCLEIKIGKAGDLCASSSSSSGAQPVECDKGLHCFFSASAGTTAPNAVCRAPAAAGGDCGSKSDCTSGLVCIKNKCASPVVEGGACTGSDCASGMSCDQKICKRITFVKGGEACDTSRRCERGSCRGQSVETVNGVQTVTPGKCIDPLPDGADCKTGSGGTTSQPGDEFQASCDVFAECIAGKCQVPDPAACK